MVALNGKLLGKPVDAEDAYRMLKQLSGQGHEVYTGVALVYWGIREFREGNYQRL